MKAPLTKVDLASLEMLPFPTAPMHSKTCSRFLLMNTRMRMAMRLRRAAEPYLTSSSMLRFHQWLVLTGVSIGRPSATIFSSSSTIVAESSDERLYFAGFSLFCEQKDDSGKVGTILERQLQQSLSVKRLQVSSVKTSRSREPVEPTLLPHFPSSTAKKVFPWT